jgi:hypothetical protein
MKCLFSCDVVTDLAAHSVEASDPRTWGDGALKHSTAISDGQGVHHSQYLSRGDRTKENCVLTGFRAREPRVTGALELGALIVTWSEFEDRV